MTDTSSAHCVWIMTLFLFLCVLYYPICSLISSKAFWESTRMCCGPTLFSRCHGVDTSQMKTSQWGGWTTNLSAWGPSVLRGELCPDGDLELLSWVFALSHLPEALDHFAILLKALRGISYLVMAVGIHRASLCCCACVINTAKARLALA